MKFAIVAGAALFLTGTANAAVTSYDNSTDFMNALSFGSSIVSDTFDNDISASDTIVLDNGVTSNAVRPNSVGNRVIGGEYHGFVDADGFLGANTISWSLLGNTYAFGFDVRGANSTAFDGVQITVNDGSGDQSFLLYDVVNGTGSNAAGFAGFVGTGSIASISFTGVGGAGGDSFYFDNATFALGSSTATVPLPAALPLMLAGFGALGFASRRRKG